jgi:hypothetical protein
MMGVSPTPRGEEYKIRVVVIPFYSQTTNLFSNTNLQKGTVIHEIRVEGTLTTQDTTTITMNNIPKQYSGKVLEYPDKEVRSLVITPAYQNNRIGWLTIIYEGHQQLDYPAVSPVGTEDQPLESRIRCKEIALLPGAARTTSGQGSGFDVQQFTEMILRLSCTAASGTSPTLNVKITTWVNALSAFVDFATALAFTQLTTTGTQTLEKANNIGQKIRVEWTIGGTTASFTFSVTAVVKG